MQNLTFVPTKEAMDWLEKNRLMMKDCTLRIDWSSGLIIVSIFYKGRTFLVCQREFSINAVPNIIEIPGITFPIKFNR